MTKLSKNSYPFADSELFKVVQMSDIFPDSKTFTDYVPIRSLEKIEAKYLKKCQVPGFSLKAFVEKHFYKQPFQSIDYQSDSTKSIEQHLGELWQVLRREPATSEGSLIEIPYPYIVPGGRFQEIYYWDSYFTILGLQASRQIDLIENIVNNFAHLINRFGYIPNGNRTYFLGRSQPPFFSLMVNVLREEKGDEILLKYLPVLVKEYQFWMQGKEELSDENYTHKRVVLLEKDVVLNRYWDEHDTPRPESYREDLELAKGSSVYPEGIFRDIRAAAESGWDFSSRWFRDGKNMSTIHTTEILPVDLNCLLFNLEKTIFRGYLLAEKKGKTDQYFALAQQREKAIEKYFFNEKKSFYCDYDFMEKSYKNHCTLAGVFPLFFNLSNSFQAKKIAGILEEKFLKDGGLTTSLNQTGQQWDAPNGWAPLQYITYRALVNYGFMELANTIKTRWMQTNEKVYLSTGKMTEKYNVETTNIEAGGGEYPNQDGFGWTNGVYLKFCSLK